MEVFGLAVPLALVVLCGAVLLAMIGWGLFWFLVQAGVIVSYARKPPHVDAGDYRLEQGRDVGEK